MPKRPDPELEVRIVAAALRLLDRDGEAAITMRSVAAEAGTTTPTIYERFRDRDALMRGVIQEATRELLVLLGPLDSIESIFDAYLRFNAARPMRFNLTVETFGTRLVAGDKMPVFDLVRSRVRQELGGSPGESEDLSLAVASLLFGTVQGMIAAGVDTRHAKVLRRASLAALRKLVAAFSDEKSANKTSIRCKRTTRRHSSGQS